MWHWSFHCNSEVARELVSSSREASGGGVGCRNANARQSNQPPDCHFRIIDRGWAGSSWIQISALPRFSCWYGDATDVTAFPIAPPFQGNGCPTRGQNGSSSNTDFIKGPWSPQIYLLYFFYFYLGIQMPLKVALSKPMSPSSISVKCW